jgi:hypothetical protein
MSIIIASKTPSDYHVRKNPALDQMLAVVIVLAVSLCSALPARAQLYAGSIAGVVSDSSGGVVPGASISLVDEQKGFHRTETTDASGRYIFRGVPPGSYALTVSAQGFQNKSRTGIMIEVNQNTSVDLALTVNGVTESVEVKDTAPLLGTQDAVTGQVVDRKFINDLPLNGRNVFNLAFLAPGVTEVDAGCVGCSANNFIANGGRNATADILMDGVSTTNYEQNSGIRVDTYTPSVDAVEEFKVQESNFSAEFGFSGATIINLVTRSGTNSFHGSAYEFNRYYKLDANNWFNNAQGIPIPSLRRNNFGGTIGGPIRRDRTFFFFDYEGLRQTSAAGPVFYGVPSKLERTGDFGELCGSVQGTFDSNGQCSNAAGQLWDPYSGTYDPNLGGPRRQAFIPYNNLSTYTSTVDANHPGNVVLASNPDGAPYRLPSGPGNLIDPVAQKLMDYYPLPNNPEGGLYLNRVDSGAATASNNQWDIKIDHRFSDNNLLSAKYSQNGASSLPFNCFGNIADPCTSGPITGSAHLFAINDTQTFSSTTILTVSYGVARGTYFYPSITGTFPKGTDPVALLGEQPYMKDSGYNWFPAVSVGGGYGSAGPYNSIGTELYSYARQGQETHHLIGSVSWLKNNHEFKFGAEGRLHRLNYTQPNYAPGGYYSFDQYGSGNYDPTCTSGCSLLGGDGMASFLMGGQPNTFSMYEIPNSVATQNFEAAGFAQDNWKITPKLTLNIGLRYDVVLPRTDRYNQMNWLDPKAISPVTLNGQNLAGGERFTDAQHRSNYDADYNGFQPRFGLAYRFNDKTVLRGGYGIYYSATRAAVAGTSGAGLQGYDQLTYMVSSFYGDGATPAGRMVNPFPNGPIQPPGSSLGLLNDVGYYGTGPIRYISNKTPYEQAWSLGIQHEIPFNVVLDAAYIGKKGTHLYFANAGGLNHLGPQVEKLTPAQIADLVTYVDNPFINPALSNASQVITDPNNPLLVYSQLQKFQLMLPYPQFLNGFSGDEPPYANSIYNALQLRAEKRFSNGLQFLITYTFSKSIDNSSLTSTNSGYLGSFASLQDPNRLNLERSLSSFDIPHVFQFSYTYEFPFGRGKAIGNNWHPLVNAILGGWSTNGIWRFASGRPIVPGLVQLVPSIPTYGPQRPNLIGTPHRNNGPESSWLNQYFTSSDGSGFFAAPDAYTLGTAARTLSSVRQPGAANADISLFKQFSLGKLHDGMRLEYRFETFNTFNHPQFCGPNTTFGDPNFGVINCTANAAREIQMALKLYF